MNIGGGYELLDAGVGRRLERFGERIVDRPAPTAAGWRSAPEAWTRAALRFDAGGGWEGAAAAREPWQVEVVDGLTMELRPTTSGGLGLYPEHMANLAWVAARVAERAAERAAPAATSSGPSAPAGSGPSAAKAVDGSPPRVLNLFAHTGLVTLAAARAGAAVTHVDAARGAVAWARRNAELSGLADGPVRWIVDDAAGFVAREARRERRYDGIILDPPSFGRLREGRRSRTWHLEDELPDLLEACAAVAADGAFVLVTAHTTGLDGDDLGAAVAAAFRSAPETRPLALEAPTGARLELGWAARLRG